MKAFPSTYQTVWLSTPAQFQAFDEAFGNASWLAKQIGRYRIPPGAAYTQSILMPWMQIPILIVASGKLDIDGAGFIFSPVKSNGFGWIRRNLRNDLAFSLGRSEISSIEPVYRRSPVSPHFDTQWTRVHTDRSAPLDEFYLAVGGRNAFAMSHYRELGLELRERLEDLQPVVPTVS